MLGTQNFSRAARAINRGAPAVLLSLVESAFLSRLGHLHAYRFAVSTRRGLQTRRTKHASNSSCRLPVHCWDGYGTIKLFLRTASAALHSAHDGAFIAVISDSPRCAFQWIRIAQPPATLKIPLRHFSCFVIDLSLRAHACARETAKLLTVFSTVWKFLAASPVWLYLDLQTRGSILKCRLILGIFTILTLCRPLHSGSVFSSIFCTTAISVSLSTSVG